MTQPLKVVICGGGVIGSSIGYYLTLLAKQHNKLVDVTIVEKVSIACSASGKAGGFLAKDWCDGNLTESLSRRSFELHAELAAELNGLERYGYRRVDALQVVADDESIDQKESSDKLEWLDSKLHIAAQKLGGTATTAQLTPGDFTNTLIEEAKKRGLKIKIGEVKGFNIDPNSSNEITEVKVSSEAGEETLPCDVAVISMGPWSSSLNFWFKDNLSTKTKLGKNGIQVTGQRAHSVIFKSKSSQPNQISAHALFTTTSFGGEASEFEVYPRPGGDIYVCGQQDSVPLPASANQIIPSEQKTDRLIQAAQKLIPNLNEGYDVVKQACYIPYSRKGSPIIGKTSDIENLFVAAGHSCWGILKAPATGLSLAELILLGQSSIDLKPFKP